MGRLFLFTNVLYLVETSRWDVFLFKIIISGRDVPIGLLSDLRTSRGMSYLWKLLFFVKVPLERLILSKTTRRVVSTESIILCNIYQMSILSDYLLYTA